MAGTLWACSCSAFYLYDRIVGTGKGGKAGARGIGDCMESLSVIDEKTRGGMRAPDGGGLWCGFAPCPAFFFVRSGKAAGQTLILRKAAFGAVHGCFMAFCAELCVCWPVGGAFLCGGL